MRPDLDALVDPSEWEIDESFLSDGLILDDDVYEVVLAAGYRMGFIRYRRMEEVADCVTGVGVADPVPDSFDIGENYPNPVANTTVFPLSLGITEQVRIDVFDMLGRRVQQVMDERLPAGEHRVTWDASQVPAGGYVVRFQVGNQVRSRRVTVL